MRTDHFYSIPPPIYPLTNHAGNHWGLAQELIPAGARWLQIRDKGRLADARLLEQLDRIQDLAKRHDARFLINDRVDLVLLAGAAGVHLGQDDVPVSRARQILGPDALVGLSTHNLDQFKQACQEPVNYIAVGPVFPTRSKADAAPVLGLSFLELARGLTKLPLVAVGGINLERAEQVWRLGIESVAVLSDIVQHVSPRRRFQQYLERAKERS